MIQIVTKKNFKELQHELKIIGQILWLYANQFSGLYSKINLFPNQFNFDDIYILVTSLHIAVQLLSLAVVALKATSAKLYLKGTELNGWYAFKPLNCLKFLRTFQNCYIINM